MGTVVCESTTRMTFLRFLAISSLVIIGADSLRADDGPLSKDEEAVRREIARLDSIKPLPSIRPLNNVSFSYQLGLNVRATFKGFGTAANTFGGSNPGPNGPGNHEYDDGYNRVDAEGNDHSAQGFPNSTTYWGYVNSSQWNHANNTVEMHSSHPSAFGDVSNDDPRHGFEIEYERVIGEHEHWYWGIEAAIGYSIIDINENRTVVAPVLTTTDAYAIPFDPVIQSNSIPQAPYQGPYQGSLGTSLLTNIPNRTVAPNGEVATLVANRHLDANVWRVHVGPKLHVPVNNRLELAFAGGVSVGVVDSHFNFSEQVIFPSSLSGISGQPPRTQGASEEQNALVGPYLAGSLVIPLTPDTRLFGGVQWEDLGRYHHSIGAHTAELDFSDSLSVSFGFSIGF
jgi:hypothetical protein